MRRAPKILEAENADLGVRQSAREVEKTRGGTGRDDAVRAQIAADNRSLALTAAADLAAFFAVILLGFAYVWRRGDLDWVRAMSNSPSRPTRKPQLVP